MITSRRIRRTLVVSFLAIFASFAYGVEEVHFTGDFAVQPNGDAKIKLVFDMPMEQYQQLRDNVSNLYLTLRELATARSDAQVVDKHADHDDANRRVTFTMTALGAARNTGDGWEFDVEKGLEFNNLDEAKHTFYFNEVSDTFSGAMRGTYRLILPGEATDIHWDSGKRIASWRLPVETGGGRGLWVGAVLLILLGGAALGASFFVLD